MNEVKWSCNYLVFIISLIVLLLIISPTVVSPMPQSQHHHHNRNPHNHQGDELIFREESPIIFNDYVEHFDTVFRRARWPPASVTEGGIFFPTEEQDQNSQRRYSRPTPSSSSTTTTTTTPKPISVPLSYRAASQMESMKKENPSTSPPKSDKMLEDRIDNFISWVKSKGLADNFVEATKPPIGKAVSYFLTISGTLSCSEGHQQTSTGCYEIVDIDYDDK